MTRKRIADTGLGAVAASVFGPLARDGETQELGDARRNAAGGEFADLGLGTVHYQIDGPEHGQRVALVNGFAAPMFTWDAVFEALAHAGFRVLRFDLYGRGLSDRPTDVDYDPDLYDTQLDELLGALGWTGRVHLAGLSMGGAIAIEYAARRPQRVASLVLFDPAGFPVNMPAAARLLTAPLLGEVLVHIFGDRVIRQNLGKNFHNPSLLPAFIERFEPQMKIVGFKYAQLSTLRHMPLSEMADRYRAVGKTDIPVLLVWGRQDRVVPYANAALIQRAIPNCRLLTVEECGHTPNYEKPQDVIPPMLDFLAANAK